MRAYRDSSRNSNSLVCRCLYCRHNPYARKEKRITGKLLKSRARLESKRIIQEQLNNIEVENVIESIEKSQYKILYYLKSIAIFNGI